MNNINDTDLLVYTQQSFCCAAREARKLAQYYLYGSECNEEQLDKVTLLNAYIEMLECYKTLSTTSTSGVWLLSFRDIKTTTVGDTINIYADSTLLLSYTVTSTTTCTELTNIYNQLLLNTTITNLSLVCGSPEKRIVFTLPCTYKFVICVVTSVVDGITTDTYIPVISTTDPKCSTTEDDNCLTEDQLKTIIENISKMCKSCFKAPGFAYYS